jgi:predicted glycoside hydrolase/deacetylase ChbG (UPF0249 family)
MTFDARNADAVRDHVTAYRRAEQSFAAVTAPAGVLDRAGHSGMTAARSLIVNADDFGQSQGINRGIMAAHARGIVTSASLMVRWPAAAEAAAYSRQHPDLSLGLHVDLAEWACRDGTWGRVYEVIPTHAIDAVAQEVFQQLERFIRLVGRKPTHLDSHQHLHQRSPLRTVLARVAHGLRIPLRHYCAGVHYCGSFYGQTATGTPLPEAISVEGLLHTLGTLPSGLTELSCHPGYVTDLETMYCHERTAEVQVLCNPRVRAGLAALGIALCSFHDVSHGLPTTGLYDRQGISPDTPAGPVE